MNRIGAARIRPYPAFRLTPQYFDGFTRAFSTRHIPTFPKFIARKVTRQMTDNSPHPLHPWARHWFLPLVGGVVMISAFAIFLAYRYAKAISDSATFQRLQQVRGQCQNATYPLTDNVLAQIATFSGTEVALVSPSGQITSSTLPVQTARVSISPTRADRFQTCLINDTDFDYVLESTPVTKALGPRANADTSVAVLIPTSRRLAILRQTVTPLIGLALASIAFVTAIATWLIRKSARRLQQMETQINRIANGDYSPPTFSGPSDSFTRLADSINSMSVQLAQAHDRIAKSERSRLINLIAGGMAHQLRNSLTGATLLLQSYQRQHPDADAEEVDMAIDQLGFAEDSVRRLLASSSGSELADDSRLTAKAIHDRLLGAMTAYARHRQVALDVRYEPIDAQKTISPGNEIVGALVNLVMNAIEAVGTAGNVSCTLRPLPTQDNNTIPWHWQIEDDGPGPPVELGRSITEAFVTSKPEGIGLGLAMAKRVAETSGGSLDWVRGDGKTTFHFRVMDKPGHG